ncbi:MAG: Xaa-Pro aminopeptidase [Myxococcaceae bacterium]|nr:Xaa-Pro aminopeptidase [Myxococcaceae bacterium]
MQTVSVPLSGFAQSRRTRLIRLLAQAGAEAPVLLPAGRSRARNYPANRYPFRASSHFLYFVGHSLEGAALWIDGGLTRLVIDPPDPDDALWHGPLPTRAELSRDTGLELLTWDELAGLRRGRQVATVPCLDRAEAEQLGALLGREPSKLGLEELDVPLLGAVVSLRLVHDTGAIHELRRAAEVSVRAHQAGMRATRPSLIERDVCAAMEHEIARAGFDLAYNSIVSVQGEVLHNHRHDNVLRTGDLLLADVGAESETGYASDITRTWPVSGRFSSTQRVIYELVWAMQRDAIAAVRPGARYRDIHLIAARTLLDGLVQLRIFDGQVDALLEDGAHALFFPHGIGHLLGLDVHDMEDLGDRAGYAAGRTRSKQFGLGYLRLDRDLLAGMVVTIEPGFYQVPSLLADPARVGLSDRALVRSQLSAYQDVRGIRIEDDVLVTDGGNEVLTASLGSAPDELEALVKTFY